MLTITKPSSSCSLRNSNIKDHWSLDHHNRYNNLKKFEILQELPKSNTETQSEQTLLEKRHQLTCSMQGCHELSIFKKKMQYLQSEIKQGMY